MPAANHHDEKKRHGDFKSFASREISRRVSRGHKQEKNRNRNSMHEPRSKDSRTGNTTSWSPVACETQG